MSFPDLRSLRSAFDQFAKHAVQIHFRAAGLEAAVHRGVRPALAFRVTRTFEEKVRIATEVLRHREVILSLTTL